MNTYLFSSRLVAVTPVYHAAFGPSLVKQGVCLSKLSSHLST